MQATMPFGSSLNLAVSSKCSHVPPTSSKKLGCGAGGSIHQLRCSTLQKPFFFGDSPANPFRFPSRADSGSSFPPRPKCDPQTKAFTKFFVSARNWGQQDPAKSPHLQNGGNGAVINQSGVQGKGQSLWQKSAWVAAFVLMGGGALYGQARAQTYIERTFLPPVAAAVGEYFGREVQLGKVQRLTPLGLTLGPCSVGAHNEEFSCAEIPGIEIRILPVASLRKGQLVVDAVIAEPHILVSQKEDWTWLGIPVELDQKAVMRHSAEPNIDSRTKVRRLSREEVGRKWIYGRKRAARDAARRGYKLPGAGGHDSIKNAVGLKLRDSEKQNGNGEIELDDSENEEGIDTTSSYLGTDEVDGVKAGQHVEERLTEGDEANTGFELTNSLLGAKVWIDTNMLRPVKRRVLRRWTKQGLHPLSKSSLQRKNLDRSAAAARAFFRKLEKNHSSGSGGRDSSGPQDTNHGSALPCHGQAPDSSVTRSRLENTNRTGASSRSVEADKIQKFGSADNGPGFLLFPFTPTNHSLPPMSISSSWGAREDRIEGRQGRPVLPNLTMQIDNAMHYKRGIEQVNFRKLNKLKSGLRLLGSRGIGRGKRGTSDNQTDGKMSEEGTRIDSPKAQDTYATSQSSKREEVSSRVTIESVKEALVQAIRERQEIFGSRNRKGLSSGQHQSSETHLSLQRIAPNSKVLNNEKVEADVGAQSQLDPRDGRAKTDLKKSAIDNAPRSPLVEGTATLPEFRREERVSELIQNDHDSHDTLEYTKNEKENRRPVTEKFTKTCNSSVEGLINTCPEDRGSQADVPKRASLKTETTSDSISGVNDQLLGNDCWLDEGKDQLLSNRTEQSMESRLMDQTKAKNSWTPVALNSVYFKDGTLMLLAFGDHEPRVMEKATGQVKLGNNYELINVRVTGSPKEFRVGNGQGDGGKIFVKVAVDLAKQEWHLKVRGRNLFAPLFEKLLELPLDWSNGRATGEVHAWMLKDDPFPSFGGRVDVKGLDFAVWDAPAPFKDVSGTLFFQGQRLFFHNASGLYGAIPLQVSGDMDLNPDDGEYRLSSQVAGVEANALMKTLKVQPPPFPLAGALKAVVHCRGPLDAPIFEGTAEVSGKQMALVYDGPYTIATQAIKDNEQDGAVAAYDRVPFASASASFTFNTDNCMAELYAMRAAPAGGGEIRGSGNLWICPEGELDPSAVNVECSGQLATNPVLHAYTPAGMDMSSISFGTMHGNAKIRGALLMPIFDIKWDTPEAQGSFDGAHGDVHICREAINLNSSALAYDLSTKIHTLYPPICTEIRTYEYKPARPPILEGLDLDIELRGFDVMGLVPLSSPLAVSSQMKVTGKVKFNGEVPKPVANLVPDNEEAISEREVQSSAPSGTEISRLVGDISLSGLKLNQLMVASHLAGTLEVSPTIFKIHATGKNDEHLHVLVSKNLASNSESPAPDSFFEHVGEGISFSLLRDQFRTDFHHQPRHSAKVEIRNLQLDELELASLRGAVQKAELALNFQKRRGQGSLSVQQPRGSGIQGKSLDIAARWSGDVITLDKSVLEQANSTYEMQGEYVLPSLRERSVIDKGKDVGMWEKAMAGQLGNMITSMGRWRLKLDVPKAEVSEMLPVARLLSRSSDPAVVSRSKELFLHGVRTAGFSAENLEEQLEYIRKSEGMAAPEGSPESIPLPGLAELKGAWHGTLEASGGGDGDTYADFELRGDEWEWGSYKTRKVIAIGDYCNNDGLRLQRFFIQKDTATLHADGLLGPKPNLHFAVLNFPVDLVPPLLHAIQSSTPQHFLSPGSRTYRPPIKGILYMEGDLRGHLAKPQCDVQIRLLDGSVGGVNLGKAEMAASLTSASRLAFNALLEPVAHSGHVRIQGSLPTGPGGLEEHDMEVEAAEREQHMRTGSWGRERGRDRKDEQDETDESLEKGGEEGWEVRLAESLKALNGEFLESGAVQVDAAVKDGGMMLLTAISPGFEWIQGNADIKLQVRGTVQQPSADGTASFYRVGISSPVLPRPLSNLGGTIRIENNQLFVDRLEGHVGRRGFVEVKGQLPLRSCDSLTMADAIEVKAESLEVRARHAFSGQVNSHVRIMGSLLKPEVTGMIKLSNGEAYLSQEKGTNSSPSTISRSPPGGGYRWMAAASSVGRHDANVFPLPAQQGRKPPGSKEPKEDKTLRRLPIDIRLRCLKLQLGPELRMVYPLILNFAVSGELELNGFADSLRVKPRGTLTFENGDVNLVATQVRLNKDHLNRAKFEPEQGLDPTLDLALIGADWQLKVQGRARNWQDNIVVSSARSGEQDALTQTEAARVFESQLAESLLEEDGQLAFKKLAAATVETLMPRIETKGEFGQARWRLVSAPQIPNLLSLDPTTDPFKSLANLSFGAEVEVQLGKHLQASVARRLKESEMGTEWTLLYQLNSKLRLLFSSVPSGDNRLLFEYSATSQN